MYPGRWPGTPTPDPSPKGGVKRLPTPQRAHAHVAFHQVEQDARRLAAFAFQPGIAVDGDIETMVALGGWLSSAAS